LQFDLDDEVFGFLAQQAVEKLLKALIAAHGVKFEFTHDIGSLVVQVAALGEEVPSAPLTPDEFTTYALHARYDIGKPLPTGLRDEIRTAVAALREYVARRVDTLRETEGS
jgi:HEPN domain-containing protein